MGKGKQKKAVKAEPAKQAEIAIPSVQAPEPTAPTVTILGSVVIGSDVKVRGDKVEIETLEKCGIDVDQLKARGLAK